MKEHIHTINKGWRAADAEALDIRARAIDDWLDHTEDLVEMFGSDAIASELRGVAGLLRSQRNDWDTAAGEIRAELAMNGKVE